MTRAAARRSAKGAWRHPSGKVFGAAAVKSRCSTPQIDKMEAIEMKLPSLSGAIPIWVKLGGLVLLALAIFAGIKACTATTNHKTDAGLTAARGEGAASAAAAAATKGLENVAKGNAAAAAVARDDDARRAGCLRHSRTPQDC